MMYRYPVSRLALILITAVAATTGAGTLGAATPADNPPFVRDLTLTTRDLAFTVVDLDRGTAETRTGNQVRVRLSADVFFAFDQAALEPEAREVLVALATRLAKQATGTVTIRGYTDSKGTKEYNRDLSRRRAQAVRRLLADKLSGSGLDLVAVGKGEQNPIAPNRKPDGSDNPKGRAKNRRVEVRFQLR